MQRLIRAKTTSKNPTPLSLFTKPLLGKAITKLTHQIPSQNLYHHNIQHSNIPTTQESQPDLL